MYFSRLDDSPMFRKQLQALEENAETLRYRSQRFYRGSHKYTEQLGEAYDGDIAFASAIDSFGGGHGDPFSMAIGGPVMSKYAIALREVATYKEVLRSQVEQMLNDQLLQFANIDLLDVKEVRKRFDKANLQYDQVRDKFLSFKKGTRTNIVIEAEEDFRKARSEFEQARFNLVTRLANIEAKKKFEFLESISGMMDAHLRYFKQGYELLLQMEPYIHQVISFSQQSRKRANDEHTMLAERMQDFLCQMEKDNHHSSIDAEYRPSGDGMQAVGRSSHKMIEAVMQLTPQGKVQTIKQGYLLKRSSSVRGDWKRRFFVLNSRGILYYYHKLWGKPTVSRDIISDAKDEKMIAHDTVNLLTSTIKVDAEEIDMRFCFRIISPTKNYTLQAESAIDRVDWIDKITGVIASLLNSQTLTEEGYSQRLSRSPSVHQSTASDSNNGTSCPVCDHVASEDSTASKSTSGIHHDSMKNSSEILKRPIDVLRGVPGNNICADCGSPEPDWASLNLCILLCIECSGIHRNLGVHISKVRSLTLDVKVWEPSVINLFQSIGNHFANSIWEKFSSDLEMASNELNSIDRNNMNDKAECLRERILKPESRDALSRKEKYIHAKYAEKRFMSRNKYKYNKCSLGICSKVWNAVERKDKQAVYGLIVCFDADVNTTYEQSMVKLDGIIAIDEVVKPDNVMSRSETDHCLTYNIWSLTDKELDIQLQKISQSDDTLDLARDGWTLLHLACYADDICMVELLLQYGAQVNTQDSFGRTALHHCVCQRRIVIAKLLLIRGANPGVRDRNGKTPLQMAMEMGVLADEELFFMLS